MTVLNDYRKSLKMTVQDVADRTGYSANYLSLVLLGHKPMSDGVASALARVFEMPVDVIKEGAER